MQNRQLQSYGCIAVGQRVEYERLDTPLKDEPKTIRTKYTVKGIRECETGALITLKGDSSTIVHAFDSHGRVWNAVQLGCAVPEALWRGAYQDREFNVINKIRHYSPTGELVEPF
jgi:hypothetical protein